MSLNKFTSDFDRKEWMKINAKVVQAEVGQFEILQSNSFETLELKIDNDLQVGDVKYTGDDGLAGSVLTTDGNGNTSFQPSGGSGGYIGNFGLYEKVVSVNSNTATSLVSKNLTNNYYGNINSGLTWNVGDSYRFEVSGSWSSNTSCSSLQSLSFDGNSTQITTATVPFSTSGGGGNGSWRFICHFSVKEVNNGLITLVQSNNFQWMNGSDNIIKCKSSNGDSSTFNVNNLDITFTNQFDNSQSTIWVYGFEFLPTHQTLP